jgi:hypothetical protein
MWSGKWFSRWDVNPETDLRLRDGDIIEIPKSLDEVGQLEDKRAHGTQIRSVRPSLHITADLA